MAHTNGTWQCRYARLSRCGHFLLDICTYTPYDVYEMSENTEMLEASPL